MPRRKQDRFAATDKPRDSATALSKAILRRPKRELVEVLLELGESDPKILRQLKARFNVAATARELSAVTRQAIFDATAFDERNINHNFSYDYVAYEEVERNLRRLITDGQFQLAMELSLELMKRGSHQVEMSDEGLMTTEIEECLGAVPGSLRKCSLPEHRVIAWCTAMLESDRVKFIATEELLDLRDHLRKSSANKHRQK